MSRKNYTNSSCFNSHDISDRRSAGISSGTRALYIHFLSGLAQTPVFWGLRCPEGTQGRRRLRWRSERVPAGRRRRQPPGVCGSQRWVSRGGSRTAPTSWVTHTSVSMYAPPARIALLAGTTQGRAWRRGHDCHRHSRKCDVVMCRVKHVHL